MKIRFLIYWLLAIFLFDDARSQSIQRNGVTTNSQPALGQDINANLCSSGVVSSGIPANEPTNFIRLQEALMLVNTNNTGSNFISTIHGFGFNTTLSGITNNGGYTGAGNIVNTGGLTLTNSISYEELNLQVTSFSPALAQINALNFGDTPGGLAVNASNWVVDPFGDVTFSGSATVNDETNLADYIGLGQVIGVTDFIVNNNASRAYGELSESGTAPNVVNLRSVNFPPAAGALTLTASNWNVDVQGNASFSSSVSVKSWQFMTYATNSALSNTVSAFPYYFETNGPGTLTDDVATVGYVLAHEGTNGGGGGGTNGPYVLTQTGFSTNQTAYNLTVPDLLTASKQVSIGVAGGWSVISNDINGNIYTGYQSNNTAATGSGGNSFYEQSAYNSAASSSSGNSFSDFSISNTATGSASGNSFNEIATQNIAETGSSGNAFNENATANTAILNSDYNKFDGQAFNNTADNVAIGNSFNDLSSFNTVNSHATGVYSGNSFNGLANHNLAFGSSGNSFDNYAESNTATNGANANSFSGNATNNLVNNAFDNSFNNHASDNKVSNGSYGVSFSDDVNSNTVIAAAGVSFRGAANRDTANSSAGISFNDYSFQNMVTNASYGISFNDYANNNTALLDAYGDSFSGYAHNNTASDDNGSSFGGYAYNNISDNTAIGNSFSDYANNNTANASTGDSFSDSANNNDSDASSGNSYSQNAANNSVTQSGNGNSFSQNANNNTAEISAIGNSFSEYSHGNKVTGSSGNLFSGNAANNTATNGANYNTFYATNGTTLNSASNNFIGPNPKLKLYTAIGNQFIGYDDAVINHSITAGSLTNGGVYADSTGSVGTSSQVLTSTGTGTLWQSVSGGSALIYSTNSCDPIGNQEWFTNSVSGVWTNANNGAYISYVPGNNWWKMFTFNPGFSDGFTNATFLGGPYKSDNLECSPGPILYSVQTSGTNQSTYFAYGNPGFVGNGSGLTSVPASSLAGTLGYAQLPGGVVTNRSPGPITVTNASVMITVATNCIEYWSGPVAPTQDQVGTNYFWDWVSNTPLTGASGTKYFGHYQANGTLQLGGVVTLPQ